MNSKNQLYLLLLIACFLGYLWLGFHIFNEEGEGLVVCPIKRVTSLPCPSCGVTRSVIQLFQGNFYKAMMINPLGYIVALVLLVAPFWILLDVLYRRSSLFQVYRHAERVLIQRRYAILLGMLILLNWIWNILKGI